MTFTLDELYAALQTDVKDLDYHLTQYHQLSIAEIARRDAQINSLTEQLADCAAPVDRTPIVTRAELKWLAGVTITKDNAPSSTQDEMTRQELKLCGTMGFTHWRGLLNFEEAAKQVTYPETDTRNLPGYGRIQKLAFMADSMDSQAKRVTDGKNTPAQYQTYIGNLKKLGATALYFNDADAGEKATFIKGWVEMTRNAATALNWDVPILGSFMATFDKTKYPYFDYHEIQCFGDVYELYDYLHRKDIAVYCLDGQRSASVDELQVNAAVTMQAHIENFFYYTAKDSTTDWRNMASQVAVIKEFVMEWRGLI